MVRLEIGPQDLNFIRKLDVCTSDVTGFQTGKRFELFWVCQTEWPLIFIHSFIFCWVEGHAILTKLNAKRVQTRFKCRNVLGVIGWQKNNMEFAYCCWDTWCELAMVEIGEVYIKKSSSPRTEPSEHGLGGDEWEPMRTESYQSDRTVSRTGHCQLHRNYNSGAWAIRNGRWYRKLRSDRVRWVRSAYHRRQHCKCDQE